MLSLLQAPGSKTVVQSLSKKWCEKSVGLGEGADRRRPLSQVARVLFSLASLACEQALLLSEWNESRENARASATCLGAWHRLYHTSLSRRRFEGIIFSPWSLVERKEIHLSEECLPAALTSCTHVLAIYQRKWEFNSFLLQITGQKWVLFFCFVWLLLVVYQSLDRLYSVQFPAFCLRFVFSPFSLCSTGLIVSRAFYLKLVMFSRASELSLHFYVFCGLYMLDFQQL